jgi:hypothetical protein
MPRLCGSSTAPLEFIRRRAHLFRQEAARQPQGEKKMTRLALTENRLPDVSFDRHSDPAKGNPNGYRFGRRSDKRVRAYSGRAVHGARGFFSAMLEMIAASKMRRIERELRFHEIRRDSFRFDGYHFTTDADESSDARK